MFAKEYDSNFLPDDKIGKYDVKYFDVREEPFRLYGVWHDGERFIRLPKEVAERVSEGMAEAYSSNSGGRVRFITDSPYVAIKSVFALVGRNEATPLSATAAIEMGVDGKFGGVFRTSPDFCSDVHVGVTDIRWGVGEEHLITLYMPTHSHLSALYVGLKPGAKVLPAPDHKYEKPVVFYGSSITHGTGCTRSGNSYPAQISKMLDMNFINLGFGGLAKGEAAMAEYIASLDMAAFVYDYDFNAPTKEHLQQTHEPFFKIIREAQPTLPILILSRPCDFRTGAEDTAERFAIIKKTYDNARAAGDENVYIINGLECFGEYGPECTVDGTHPNDFGYRFMAERISRDLKKILDK